MTIEFVCVLSCSSPSSGKVQSTGQGAQLHGSVIKDPTFSCREIAQVAGQRTWLYTVVSEGETLVPELSQGKCLFDGEAVYKKAHSRNHEVVDYHDFTRNARGSFCVLSVVEGRGGVCIKATNDPMGLYPLFFMIGNQITLITNNPMLSETISREFYGVELKRHDQHAINEIVTGAPLDIGPYEGMRYMPFDTELIISENDHTIKRKEGSEYYYSSSLSFEELLDKAKDEVCENVLAVADSENYDVKISDISGGIDSRMILAAILATKRKNKFFYNTSGKYPNPDANVGNYIIERFGLRKCKIHDPGMDQSRGSFGTDPEKYIRTFCYVSSGIKNNVARHVNTKSSRLNVFRVGGGFSAYKANKSKLLKDGDDINDAVNLITKGDFCIPQLELERVKSHVKDILYHWVENDSMTIAAALDRFHIEHRGRYHIGACEHWGRYHGGKSHPLNSPSLVRASFKVSDEDRLNDVVTFSLMYKLFPPLTFTPLESRRWNPEAYQSFSDNIKLRLIRVPLVTYKSKKLFKKEPSVSVVKISDIEDQEGSRQEVSRQENKRISVSEWKAKQQALKRKWYWTELDKVSLVFNSLYDLYKKRGGVIIRTLRLFLKRSYQNTLR